MKAITATISMSASAKFHGGIPALFAGYLIKIVYMLPVIFLWRVLADSGADLGGLTLAQLLTYTCVSTIFRSQLDVDSNAVTWHYEGQILDLYRRPQTIFGQLIFTTIGKWLPELLLFSLPLIIILPFFGVNIIPHSVWFFPCFILSVSLAFAIDFIFSCFIIHMKNAAWFAYVLKRALLLLFSGAVIPFDLLPWGLGNVFKLLPFGSMAGAALSVFTGMTGFSDVIMLQILWNIILWPLAFLAFRGCREKMVSYGG